MKYILFCFLIFITACSIRVYSIDISGNIEQFKISVDAQVPHETNVDADPVVKIPIVP